MSAPLAGAREFVFVRFSFLAPRHSCPNLELEEQAKLSAHVRQTTRHRREQLLGLCPSSSDRRDRVKRALNHSHPYVAMDALGEGPLGVVAGLVLRNTRAG